MSRGSALAQLDRGFAALAAGRWEDARTAFEQSLASQETPEALEGLSWAAWWLDDAEALPFGDGEFDVVTSSFGAMFAPDHRAVADELVRVCRPGGTIGMANFPPDGLAADFFSLFAHHPPRPGTRPPVMWGTSRTCERCSATASRRW